LFRFVPLSPELCPAKNKWPLVSEIIDDGKTANGDPNGEHKDKQRKSVTNNNQNPSWKLQENDITLGGI
jgi:hypothetical protein